VERKSGFFQRIDRGNNVETGRRPDWQLPVGVDRALWDYLQSRPIADDYDEYFRETHLLQVDQQFLDSYFVSPGRLVDLGCGTGRLAVHFSKRGFEVTGVDLSDAMLEVCRQKSLREGCNVHLVRENICRLDSIESAAFDYAICMFSTLGMIVGVEHRRQALAEVFRVLKPGGWFGLHLHNRWYNAFNPQGRWWLLQDLCKSLAGAADAGDKVQVRYRGIPNLRLHIYTAAEVRRTLTRAGFRLHEQRPLAADRRGKLFFPWAASCLRANGWLVRCQKPGS
jgi:ubiquinone/menaquinone biosynthesis C-methylase UbiE